MSWQANRREETVGQSKHTKTIDRYGRKKSTSASRKAARTRPIDIDLAQ